MNQEILQEASKLTAHVAKRLVLPGITVEEIRNLMRVLEIVNEALDSSIALDAFVFATVMRNFDDTNPNKETS